MEMERYVNSAADEGRERQQRGNHHSGWSKVFWLVGVSFGLLCIIQTALNVSLRLQAVECSEKSINISTGNVTVSACDSTVRDQLEKERDQLVQEKKQLVQEKQKLAREKKQLVQERDQLVQEKDQLVQQRDQLVQEKQKLAREKQQLVQERDQLTKENAELHSHNHLLTEDKRMLSEKVTELQNKLTMGQHTSGCPQGWRMYMSSCYKHSSISNTWEYAKQNCAHQGSHLVIFDGGAEERAVLSFGYAAEVWMGLSGYKNPFTNSWTWTRVDEGALSYRNLNHLDSRATRGPWHRACAYVYQGSSTPWTWSLGRCEEQHHWVCEKELHAN